MSLVSRLLGWMFKLPPAETYDVVVERDVKVPMPDGVTLLADHYYPRSSAKRPTILVRSPYGRRSIFGLLNAQLFAERGFQVFVQSCRGTFGSGGELNPFRQERADGLATLEWIKKQDWFTGDLATLGGSYLGYVQWAIAREAQPELKAMLLQVTAADLRRLTYGNLDSLALDNMLGWANQVNTQEQTSMLSMILNPGAAAKKIEPAWRHLPLIEVDELTIGKPVRFFREWLEHNAVGDPWWATQDHRASIPEVKAPAHLIGGWYDIFLPDTFDQYRMLKDAGRAPYLTIGPWTHVDPTGLAFGVREGVIWFRAHLLGDRRGLRELPVRIYVMGANEWRDYPKWPPADARPQRWHLQPGGGLAPAAPTESEPDRYRYDPADPTPAVGGALLGVHSGPKDNRRLEARHDVLTYTSGPLDRDVEVIGPITAELYVRSSLQHTDFFARLCDVHPSGRSVNICDELLPVIPDRPAPEADGCLKLTINVWPTAHRFLRGHRIRLQVSSGAHPRFARNTGSGEPLATATTLRVADQTVYHDPAHPSAITLPVMS